MGREGAASHGVRVVFTSMPWLRTNLDNFMYYMFCVIKTTSIRKKRIHACDILHCLFLKVYKLVSHIAPVTFLCQDFVTVRHSSQTSTSLCCCPSWQRSCLSVTKCQSPINKPHPNHHPQHNPAKKTILTSANSSRLSEWICNQEFNPGDTYIYIYNIHMYVYYICIYHMYIFMCVCEYTSLYIDVYSHTHINAEQQVEVLWVYSPYCWGR
jgi:hypothetical protein